MEKHKLYFNMKIIEPIMAQKGLTRTELAKKVIDAISDENGSNINPPKLGTMRKWLSDYFGTGGTKAKSIPVQEYRRVEIIANILDSNFEDITYDPNNEKNWLLTFPQMDQKLQDLANESQSHDARPIISIVTSGKILEIDNNKIFELMVLLLEKGVEIRYFYPENLSNELKEQFLKLKNSYTKKMNNSTENKVKFINVSIGDHHLFPWSGQNIIITKNSVNDFYISVTAVNTVSDSMENRWVLQPPEFTQKFLDELHKKSDTINSVSIYEPHSPTAWEESYFRKLKRNLNIFYKNYNAFIHGQLFAKFSHKLQIELNLNLQKKSCSSEQQPLRVLYIGYGDGVHLQQISSDIIKVVEKHSIPGVAFSAIDAAIKQPKRNSKTSAQISFHYIHQHFEHFDFRQAPKYDLILAPHSLHFLQDDYIVKIYEGLKRTGIAFVTLPSQKASLLGYLEEVIQNRFNNSGNHTGRIHFAETFFKSCENVFGDNCIKPIWLKTNEAAPIDKKVAITAAGLYYGHIIKTKYDKSILENIFLMDIELDFLADGLIVLDKDAIDNNRRESWLGR